MSKRTESDIYTWLPRRSPPWFLLSSKIPAQCFLTFWSCLMADKRTSSIFLLDVALRIELCLVQDRPPALWLQWHLIFRWRIYDAVVDAIPWTMKWIMSISTLQGDAGRLQASRQQYPFLNTSEQTAWTSFFPETIVQEQTRFQKGSMSL